MSWVMRKRIHQIDLFLNYPHEVQKERPEGLLETAEKTERGLTHGYKDIKSYESYKNRVPLSDYEAISPYINRLRKGEENILWPTKSKWFAKSSGTSGSRSNTFLLLKSHYTNVTSKRVKTCFLCIATIFQKRRYLMAKVLLWEVATNCP